MPYPNIVVEEVEGQGYRIPQFPHRLIPFEVGGQITITLGGRGVLQVGEKKFDCPPGTAFLYCHSDPSVSYYFPRDGREKWRFVWINFRGETSSRSPLRKRPCLRRDRPPCPANRRNSPL